MVVDVDTAYISPETAEANPDDSRIVEGVPVLVAEVHSPSDKHEDITAKVESYLEAGVNYVWVMDPKFRTVAVYRPDAEPQLPGFRLPVQDIFAR